MRETLWAVAPRKLEGDRGFTFGRVPKWDAVVLDRANHMADADCQAIEQTGNYCHPFLCGVKLPSFAKG